MNEELQKLAYKAHSKKRDFKDAADKIRKLKPARADELFHQLHEQAFAEINCLECANCCKQLGPRLTNSDIRRLSSQLKMKTSDFTAQYLNLDEDHDYVFRNMPCPFLLPDNYCMVYSSRPKACKDYPHTDQKNIKSIINACIKNTETCPAVFYIFENL